MFRLIRSSERIEASITRYRLTAVSVAGSTTTSREVSADVDAEMQLDKLHLGQAISTPETTFERLWEQLRVDLDLGYA